ncbi:hypothetical protein [Aureispira anguillae]|uniref:Uncharacterized protein n=1 Tax=Aureispira anguillae TaxID=2864201 RepID=A0A916DXZ3_9BACT|nr:hypothetical protein [Aureispira anguillae]BDS15536.1 hypothetical protein AsAng_0063200 [Aureispira anguillae]
MEHYRVNKLLLILLLAISFNACKNILSYQQMEKKLKKLEQFTYQFGDASVPPPFHRSYTIVANKDSILLTVDSYGDTLVQKKYQMPEDGLTRIGQALIKNKIHKRRQKKEANGCTGGTTQSIAYRCHEDAKPFSASRYNCGGEHYGTLMGDIDSFLVDIYPLTPDLKEVLRSTQ